ncbi:hypothetical protein Golomagni_05703 [Golovinomyces magnicellulatus]|nr:hypothetical protein Golomagni_05703 [Golovinomyces magnicellulatus]
MYLFIEKIVILALIAFSKPTFSYPHIRRQVSAASCNDDTRAFALGLQNIITTQTQEITTTTKMISTISSVNFDRGVFKVQQSELVTEIKQSISAMQISQNIQIGNNLLSSSLIKLTEMQTTQLSLVQQLGSSSINMDIAMESLNELSVSLKSCVQQSQQVLKQTLSVCPDIRSIDNNQLPSIETDNNLSNTSSNKVSNNTDDNKRDDNKKDDSKRDDNKKDDSKRDDNKKDDSKKDDSKNLTL